MDQHHGIFNYVTNAVGVGTIVGALWGAIPIIGAMVAIIWYAINIVESATYKNWSLRRHKKRVAKAEARLAYLRSLEYREDA